MMRLYPVFHAFPTVVGSLQQKRCVVICFLLVNLGFISMSGAAAISTADPLSTEGSATSNSVKYSAYPDSSTSTPATSILFRTMINTFSSSSTYPDSSTSTPATILFRNMTTTSPSSSAYPDSSTSSSAYPDSSTSTPATSILFRTMTNTSSSSSAYPDSSTSSSAYPDSSTLTPATAILFRTMTNTSSSSSAYPDSSTSSSAYPDSSTSTPATAILFRTMTNTSSPSPDFTSMSTTSASSIEFNSNKHTSAHVSTSSILSSTCKMPSVTGGAALPSAGGTAVVISCFSGFNIQGASVLQCVNGSWNFPIPTCFRESHLKSDVHNKIDVNDIGLPTWLLWTLCAVFGLLGLLLLCCVLYICLKMCGCVTEPFFGFNQVHPYAPRRVCCTFCRGEFDPGDGDYVRRHKQRQRRDTELTFSLPNENGRRGHSRRIRSFSDSGLSSQPPESPQTNRKLVVKVRKKKRAKSIPNWLPHSNPLRDINTSTK